MVPLHPGVKLGSPCKSEMGTALDIKTTGENNVSYSVEREYPNSSRRHSSYRRSRKHKLVVRESNAIWGFSINSVNTYRVRERAY